MKVREAAYIALNRIDINGEYSSIVLKEIAQRYDLEGKDRKLFWEIVLGVLRWKIRIDFGLSRQIKRYKKLPQEVKNNLRLGYYQLLFLDRIPPYSVVYEAVEIAKKHLPVKFHKFTNAVLRKALKLPYPVVLKNNNVLETSEIIYSTPSWIISRWKDRFGIKEAIKIMKALNSYAPFVVWINNFFASFSEIRKVLKEMGIDARPFHIYHNEMLEILTTVDLSSNPLFKEGLITIQDPASYTVVKVLSPNEEDFILDCCAAPGIKSAQIALAMKNKGRIIAVEVDPKRYESMLDNIKRMGAAIVEPINADITEIAKDFQDNSFDKILLDAPCSDMGTLRRRPEIKYRRTKEDITLFSEKQKAILKSVYKKLKIGGELVYSVCSFEKEETEDVMRFAIEELGMEPIDFRELLPDDFRPYAKTGYIYLLPHITRTDGFFIMKLKRMH